MRNLLAPRRKLRLLLLSTVLLAVGAGVLFEAVRADADSVGTLQVHGTFKANYNGIDCPAGIPAATSYCFHDVSVRADLFPGVGEVTTVYTVVHDGYGSACEHVHAQIPLLVAGKGEIDLAMRSTGCISPNQPSVFGPTEVTVTGGNGRYAGASGSGVLDYLNHNYSQAPGTGVATVTWTGTLNVAGLTFDTTPPQITGATSKAAKTRSAKGARVRYPVSAADATDGPVPAACLPKSGSRFRVGRTTVNCTADDSSGNTATAHFVITVKRTHR